MCIRDSHLTVGEDDHWYNGFNQRGDYGPTKTGAETIPPIITRGVLLDIAGYKGVDHVDANYGITIDDIIGCAEWELSLIHILLSQEHAQERSG